MIKWSVHHRSIVMLIAVLILLGGFLIYGDMERQENPTVVSPIAVVKCIYPGASPEDVEKLIIKPLETEINEIAEIDRLESFAMDSIGIIKVKLKDISDERTDKVWDELKDDVDEVKKDLPSEAFEPEVDTDFTDTYGVLLGLTSEQYTYEDLKKVAEKLKDQLELDPGVKAVDIDGEINQEIHINLDMVKLKQYEIAPNTIVKALKARNVNIPGGNLEINKIKVPVKISGEYEHLEEIKDTIVGVSESGTPIYLRNVAEVIQIEEKEEVFTRVDNKKSLIIGIKYADKENMIKIEKRLKKIIEKFKKEEVYEGMDLVTITAQADFVDEAISLFEDNLISAVILVVLVVLIAMGFRSAFVVSFPIPLVIAMVFIYMKLFEIPLHQVSIASLIISLSLLVANGIVANDSMYLYLERGHDREIACTKGVKEVGIAILTSTLTSIASFLPLAMMQGSAGKFVKSLPILVSVALFGSYLTALTIVPAMGYTFLKVKKSEGDKESLKTKILKKLKIEGIFKWFLDRYRSLLNFLLKTPKLVLIFFLVVFILSMAIVPSLGVQLFPPVERDQYIIDVAIQDGSTSEKMGEVAKQIGDLLLKDKSVDSFMWKVGDGLLKYYITFMPIDKSSNKAQFIVNGDQKEINRIQTMLDKKVPGVRSNVRKLELAVPVDFPIQVRITGEEIPELRRIAEDIKNIVDDIPGGKNVQDTFGYDSYKLNIKVNEEKANLVGLTNYDVASTVRMAVNGLDITNLKQDNVDDDDIPVIIKIPEKNKKDREVLDNIFFTSSITGQNIPIHQIAKIDNEFSLNKVIRRNTKRTITVGMFVKDGYNTEAVLKQVEEELKDYELPKDYTMEFGGESEERVDAFTSMKAPSVLAVIIIYLILVMQFGDLRRPLIIMGTIPLSFIGVVWGLKLTGYPVGFMALLGAISLMGVVVNNGIVLLDYIKLISDEYESLRDAVVEACCTRVRPIMIGMITTVISLIPLALSGGLLWAPMATAIIFGMIISSILTLFAIPSAYIVVEGEETLLRRFTNYLKSK
jgi:multidrug efflux pump subunit AcrB